MPTMKAVSGKSSARFAAANDRPVNDGLANLMTGGGTTIDRRMYNRWLVNVLVRQEVEEAYRGSWLMRKVIDLPAEDMTRAWRTWQADGTQIEKLEDEEKRLHVRERVKQALTLGRLGGGLLVMGFGDDPKNPLNLESVGEEGLQYLYIVNRWDVKVGDPVDDPASPLFGEPETFEITINSKQVVVHHTRAIVFKGLFSGKLSVTGASDFWGDPVVTALSEPVANATTVHNEFATLVMQAKIDLLKIPDLMANAGNAEYEKRFLRRMELANFGKSSHRALIIDASEDWEQRQLTLTGMGDLATTYMQLVAGAADIPSTRLLGSSPDGMNATGDSDQDNYNQMIRSKQDNELRPLLDKLDEPLIRSALGSRPPEVYYDFDPLDVPDESEEAETENKEATTLKTLVDTGLFEDAALEEAYSQRMVDSGRWPGYEKARKKALAEAEAAPTAEDVAGVANPPAPGAPAVPGSPTTQPVHIHVGGASSAAG